MEYKTKTGRVLTDADIEKLADEAEQGYAVSKLRPAWAFVIKRMQETMVPTEGPNDEEGFWVPAAVVDLLRGMAGLWRTDLIPRDDS